MKNSDWMSEFSSVSDFAVALTLSLVQFIVTAVL